MAPFRPGTIACALVLAALTSGPPPTASAENGVIKVVLPVPPGGAGDLIARLLTDQVAARPIARSSLRRGQAPAP
jgi:tripartite-type tricarboxylate transporter receptor subunit TctC